MIYIFVPFFSVTDCDQNYMQMINLKKLPEFGYKSSYQKKNTCQNFPTQKNPEIENFKPQKILRSSLSLEIWSTPPPPELKPQKVLTSISLYYELE